MRKLKMLLLAALVFTVGLGYVSPGLAADRVLVLHSYHADYPWVKDINSAVEPLLKAASIPYRFFYMDTKRKSGLAWKKESARNARKLIDDYAPKVVVAFDDNAQAFVVKHYVGKSSIQFVFAGVNADPEKYGYPAENVTGILERAYPDQVLNMLKMISPTSLKMAWVSDDSATANLVLPRVRRMAQGGKLPLSLERYLQPSTFDQWKKAIRRLESDPGIGGLLIPLYHTVKTGSEGKSALPADVMKWTVQNTTKPVVGFWSFSTDDGAICSVVVDAREHGKVAALMAKQIVAGKKAHDLPMVVNQDGFVIINIAAAAKLGIEVPFEVMLIADKIIE